MDLHTAGNHRDCRLSVTDGVCQHFTCSLCFPSAIRPVEPGAAAECERARTRVRNSSKCFTCGPSSLPPPRIHLTQRRREAEKT